MNARFIPPQSRKPNDRTKHKAWSKWITLPHDQRLTKVRGFMDQGMTTTETAQRLGISRQTLNVVIQQLKAQGWKRLGDVSPDEALRLAEQGLSTKEISDRLLVGHDLVRARLKAAGWHNPWQEEAIRLREQVKPLLHQDLMIQEISDRLQVPYSRVLRAKQVLVAAECEGTYPARCYLKRSGRGGRKPRNHLL